MTQPPAGHRPTLTPPRLPRPPAPPAPPRRTADTINDDALDELYDRAARAEAALSDMTRDRDRQTWYVNEGRRKARIQRERVEQAEATLARVRTLRDDLHGITGARYIADALDTILNGKQPGPASTAPLAAGLPLVRGHCPACGWASLFLGSGGHATCSRIDCPNPCAADDLLHGSDNSGAWQPQDNGSWTLDLGDGRGVITMPRQTTMRERAQFAAAWAATSGRPMLPSAATEATEPAQTTAEEDDPPVQCWHTEADTPCDWDVCKQPERLAAGDYGTDPRGH